MSKQYWIQYDSNDVIKKSEFVFDDETLFLQIPTPKEGYTFVGWINKDNKIIIGEYTPTCDETLKPLWIPNYLDYKLTSDGVCKIKFKKIQKKQK